jgi:hypothetical protein
MKKNFYPAIAILLLVLFSFLNTSAQVNNWIGGLSTDYFNKLNWSDPTLDFANLNAWTLQIGAGVPNNCVLNGGNSSNVLYRANRINTLTGGVFTVNGAVYPNNNDSLNGTIIINSPADFNIRNIAYIGNKGNAIMNITGGKLSTKNGMYIATGTAGSATVNVSGGAIFVGGGGVNMDLNLANGAGLTAQLNLTGGSITIQRNLNIGTAGSIFISGLGSLVIVGDKTAQLNGLVSDGRLTCPAGQSLSILYNGTNTVASISVNSNSMIREYSDSVVLKTTDLVCVLEKSTGNVISYRYKGKETVANKSTDTHKYMYHDFTTSYGFETIYGCTYEIVQDSTEFAHIVFKRPYDKTKNFTPADCELHYALRKDDKGVYVYSKLEHKPTYPTFDIGSWRQVWWLAATNGINLTERIYTDSLRSWQMPAPADTYDPTPIAEIIKMTSGVRNGKYDGKYEYSLRMWDNPVWGHASNVNNIGIWCLNASCEYFNEGPMHHDLVSAAGIIHQCMNGVHYGDIGMTSDTLTSWTKVYGPYMLLITDKSTGDSNWMAAKERQLQERLLWPYNWVKDTIAYPPASKRGAIAGKFVISDAQKPSVTGAGFWIGVTDLSDGATNFQFECKNYQHWIKTEANGTFTIPNVRPGTYSLFAFGDGAVGEYRLDNVTVTAGNTNNLGTITRSIDRTYGNVVWEIGKANRMSDEYRLGKFDYCEGFVERKFRDTFPALIEYNVAQNNWETVLPYAHTKYPDASFAPADNWKWRLNFTLPAGFPATGNARLTIAYSSNDHAQQWIYVNNENTTFTTYYPDNGDGNAFVRQANYAKYSYKQILIPMSKFVAGNNVITLVMPSNSLWVSHLMYDYISLEANVGALPVSLLNFTAKPIANKQVALNWSTANEVNNKQFLVERSSDGRAFDVIGNVVVAAAANGGSANYNMTDKTPAYGDNYYRLKQVDKDGRFTYSAVRKVSIVGKISVYPNPAARQITVTSVTGKSLLSIEMFNADGKLVYSDKNLSSSSSIIQISSLPAGMYVVQVNDGSEVFTEKIRRQ